MASERRRRTHALMVRLDAREKAALTWLVATSDSNANAVIRSLIVRAADQPHEETRDAQA